MWWKTQVGCVRAQSQIVITDYDIIGKGLKSNMTERDQTMAHVVTTIINYCLHKCLRCCRYFSDIKERVTLGQVVHSGI